MILSAGCSFEREKAAALEISEKYLSMFKEQRFTDTKAMLAKNFFDETPKDMYLDFLNKVTGKLGALGSWEIADWNIEKKRGLNTFNGYRIYFIFKVQYEKFPGTIKITLIRHFDEEEYKVAGVFFTSDGLLE